MYTLKCKSFDHRILIVRRKAILRNILVSTQVNVDGFLKKTFSATFKIPN